MQPKLRAAEVEEATRAELYCRIMAATEEISELKNKLQGEGVFDNAINCHKAIIPLVNALHALKNRYGRQQTIIQITAAYGVAPVPRLL